MTSLSKSTSMKIFCTAVIVLLFIDSISAIIGKHKSKHKHKDDDDDDYDDDDPSCYPGRNCVPGCYCSGESCRPYFPPHNAAEAKLKCKTFHYDDQKKYWKKKKGHKHSDLNVVLEDIQEKRGQVGLSSLLTKFNFSTHRPNVPEDKTPLPVLTLGELQVAALNETVKATAVENVVFNSSALLFYPKPVHPSQRNLR